jgi:hypothetical protein
MSRQHVFVCRLHGPPQSRTVAASADASASVPEEEPASGLPPLELDPLDPLDPELELEPPELDPELPLVPESSLPSPGSGAVLLLHADEDRTQATAVPSKKEPHHRFSRCIEALRKGREPRMLSRARLGSEAG